ncbi:hypothetical protein PISL3812_09554 [Talaromyces islandicus]|uniref:Conserved oligomeric Golgi complex subunit 8 n=1 Tax=Talaromyces islandicus TaxID=28573 RepID=A0A0U1MA21_TALIS|nr:hypothetical protein PISL3812_09554 [Talaromyces islandicus]
MADSILEVLAPHVDNSNGPASLSTDTTAVKYMNRLTTLSLESLKTTEPQSISHSAHSTLLSLQALSNRSHKAFITSADHLSNLQTLIPSLAREAKVLQNGIPKLDEEAVRFSTRYAKTGENQLLDRRKKAMQLSRNVDRISDILELPALLSTAVSSSSPSSAANSGPAAGSSLSTSKYSTALDLYSHIKRLQSLYPDSPLIKDIVLQAEDAMKDMTTNLIAGLRTQNIRLAAAMRTVGWLRRVAPELESPRGKRGSSGPDEGAFGALFLVCRLASLVSTLEALEPLKELADQETKRRTEGAAAEQKSSKSSAWSGGQQTERFLKRYIEIYREQSFAIVSLYKNIFTTETSDNELMAASISGLKTKPPPKHVKKSDPLQTLPPALATFPIHLVQLLTDTLRSYLPNVRDKSSRESLLTQVLYCAASLGRLGGDFSMILTELEADEEDEESEDGKVDVVREWEQVMRKHRDLAGKLEQLTQGPLGANAAKSSTLVSPA